MIRKEVLETAIKCTCDERNRTHGEPSQNLHNFYALWSVFEDAFEAKNPEGLDSHPAFKMAMLNTFGKLARICSGDYTHTDNYVDAAAYLAIAVECLAEEKGIPTD